MFCSPSYPKKEQKFVKIQDILLNNMSGVGKDTPKSISNTQKPQRGRPHKISSSKARAVSTGDIKYVISKVASTEGRNKRPRTMSVECLICSKEGEEGDTIKCQVCKQLICKDCSGIPKGSWVAMRDGLIPGGNWMCVYCRRTVPSLTKWMRE